MAGRLPLPLLTKPLLVVTCICFFYLGLFLIYPRPAGSKDFFALLVMYGSAVYLATAVTHYRRQGQVPSRKTAGPFSPGRLLIRYLPLAAILLIHAAVSLPAALDGIDLGARDLVLGRHQDEYFSKKMIGFLLDEVSLHFADLQGCMNAYGSAHLNLVLFPLFPARPWIMDCECTAFIGARLEAAMAGVALLIVTYCFTLKRYGISVAAGCTAVVATSPAILLYCGLSNTPDLLCATLMVTAILLLAMAVESDGFMFFLLAAALSGAAFATKLLGVATFGFTLAVFTVHVGSRRPRRLACAVRELLRGSLALGLAFLAAIGVLAPYLFIKKKLLKGFYEVYFGAYLASGLPGFDQATTPGSLTGNWRDLAGQSALDTLCIAFGVSWACWVLLKHLLRSIRNRRLFLPLTGETVIATWVIAWSGFITVWVRSMLGVRWTFPVLPLLVLGSVAGLRSLLARVRPGRTAWSAALVVGVLAGCLSFAWPLGRSLRFSTLANAQPALGVPCWEQSVVTGWLRSTRVPRLASIFSDSCTFAVAAEYPEVQWGQGVPTWQTFTRYQPDILILSRSFMDYYQALPEAVASQNANLTEAQEIYGKLRTGRLFPYERAWVIPANPSESDVRGEIYTAPWVRMENVLAGGRVRVTRSSAFCSRPYSPQDVFDRQPMEVFNFQDVYAASQEKNGGCQFIEFELKRPIILQEIRYVIVNWGLPMSRATSYSLSVKQGQDWIKILDENNRLDGPLAKVGVDVFQPVVALTGNEFRLEAHRYEGEQSLILRRIAFYRDQ
jgi:hypothetical protein